MEKSVAKNLIKEGADVIAQHQDSSGPQEAAQEQGTYSIGYNTDHEPGRAQGSHDLRHMVVEPRL